jgi:TolA-binding protein
MHWLASVYTSQKQYRDAEALFKQTLAGQEKVLGTKHEDTLETMYWLACVYEEQGQYDKAQAIM